MTVCRCGQPRPEAPFSEQPDLEAASPSGATGGWSWLPKVLPVLLAVALYFGSRLWNRHQASEEARAAAVQVLSEVMPADEAKRAVSRHQAVCFEECYKTGWGRRASSTFDGEKYAKCVMNRLSSDLDQEAAAPPRPLATARPRPLPPVTTPPMPSPPPFGPVTLGDLKILAFQRQPQATVQASFVAVGKQMRSGAFCAFLIACEGRARGLPLLTPCTLKVDGIKATGELHYALKDPAPAESACRLELSLSDGSSVRSNTVAAPLP